MMNNKIEHQEYTSNILNEYRLKYGISAWENSEKLNIYQML